ncbi:MAG: bifunctional hydroxymethylpyrimidine kinase/phosphomethylpyrimidine kinase [Pseudomonadota bacterium]|nr:bifunctional hydroxymethylpyrimidine kinase/phosphomethylpyrimidine kinase [Pseudomonadota bacterium]
MRGRVLIVAGSDSSGGAGIQADIKTVTALGGFAATAITALTAQNTLGVHGFLNVDTAFVRKQIQVVLNDVGADIVKTGMLHNADVIGAVCEELDNNAPGIPLVVDPVMVAKGGEALIDEAGVRMIFEELIPRAYLITPNIPEAETLLKRSIKNVKEMKKAAEALTVEGASSVLIKGGHLLGDKLTDVLLDRDGFHFFEIERVKTRHTHGTGCTLASAISISLSQGLTLPAAVGRAQEYVVAAIRSAPGLGAGHGPLNHTHPVI